MNPLKFEPILINQLVASGLALVVAFGLPVSDDQRRAILEFAGVVIAIFLGGGLVSRSIAWSPASVEREVSDAFDTGYASGQYDAKYGIKEENGGTVFAER